MKSVTRKLGHREIFELVRRDVLAGKYDGENKLPSETALARKFGVGRQTMGRVMLDLKREGLVGRVSDVFVDDTDDDYLFLSVALRKHLLKI